MASHLSHLEICYIGFAFEFLLLECLSTTTKMNLMLIDDLSLTNANMLFLMCSFLCLLMYVMNYWPFSGFFNYYIIFVFFFEIFSSKSIYESYVLYFISPDFIPNISSIYGFALICSCSHFLEMFSFA